MAEPDIEYWHVLYAALLHDVGKLLAYGSKDVLNDLFRHAHSDYTKNDSPPAWDGLETPAPHHALLSGGLITKFATGFKSLGLDAARLANLAQHHHFNPKAEAAPFNGLDPRDLQGEECELAQMVNHADNLASGSERGYEKKNKAQALRLPLASIFSRVDIGEGPSGWTPSLKFHGMTRLEPSGAFPVSDSTLDDQNKNRLVDEFLSDLQAELDHAPTDLGRFYVRLTTLLETFTWCVPHDQKVEASDTALFDHLRMTSAISACLHVLSKHDTDWDQLTFWQEGKPVFNESRFLLVGGDLSGIQDYIFQVSNSDTALPERRVLIGVGKRLRARSFYLSILMQAIAKRILISCAGEAGFGDHLPFTCEIYNSGGKFYLLLPNTDKVLEWLVPFGTRTNEWLFGKHQGDLALSLAWEDVSPQQLYSKKVPEIMVAVDKKLQIAKSRKHMQQFEAGKSPIWPAVEKEAYPYGVCPACHLLQSRVPVEEVPDIEKAFVGDKVALCKQCEQDRVISEQLVKTDYLAYWEFSGPDEQDDHGYSILEGDDAVKVGPISTNGLRSGSGAGAFLLDALHSQPAETSGSFAVRRRPQCGYVPVFDRLPGEKDEEDHIKYCRGCTDYLPAPGEDVEHKRENTCEFYRFLHDVLEKEIDKLGTPRPVKLKAPLRPPLKSFTCIANEGRDQSPTGEPTGAQLLGILKADVDNLGLIMEYGIQPAINPASSSPNSEMTRLSLSRLATASRMVDLFFSGWVHEEMRNNPDFQLCYTVFSGGDDLLLVGPWLQIIAFASHLRREFMRFTGDNPNIHLSAAITVTKPHYPLGRSVAAAASDLESAKAKQQYFTLSSTGTAVNDKSTEGKNAVSMFGRIVSWHDMLDVERPLYAPEEAEGTDWVKAFTQQAEKENRSTLGTAFLYRLLAISDDAYRFMMGDEQTDGTRAPDPQFLRCFDKLAYQIGRARSPKADSNNKLLDDLERLTKASSDSLVELANLRVPLTLALYANRK